MYPNILQKLLLTSASILFKIKFGILIALQEFLDPHPRRKLLAKILIKLMQLELVYLATAPWVITYIEIDPFYYILQKITSAIDFQPVENNSKHTVLLCSHNRSIYLCNGISKTYKRFSWHRYNMYACACRLYIHCEIML